MLLGRIYLEPECRNINLNGNLQNDTELDKHIRDT